MTNTGRYCSVSRQFRRLYATLLCLGCLLVCLLPQVVLAQTEPAIEETSVFLNVTGLGGQELDVVVRNEKAYLSVADLFDYLKIKNQPSANLDSLSGFFLFQNNAYVIDNKNHQIILQNKIYPLDPDDLIQTTAGLYLKSTVFGKVFGLYCVFNFRNLSVDLNTKLDLPALRERRQELMRSNISKLRNEITADTIIRRKYQAFNFGNTDWNITSTQQTLAATNASMNLRLGGIVAGGETDIALNYDTRSSFKLYQQNYYWRYVNNDNAVLKQVIACNIATQSTSSLIAPVVGIQLTNSPTTYRRSFGTYTLSEVTEPEWMVELYINNVLVDYVKADASGFFTFKVPLVYGISTLQLRFFGPAGEEKTRFENLSVPYNFLPKNETQYIASAGILEDGRQSRFSRIDLKYGVSRILTIGSGVEYLSSVTPNPVMPFIDASLRLASNLILSSDYTYGVRARATINYRMPYDFLFELDYIRYTEGQQAIFINAIEEQKAVISKPFNNSSFSGFAMLTIDRLIYSRDVQTFGSLLFSATWQGISSNLTTYAQLANPGYLDVYSNLSLAVRLPRQFVLRPQVQYSYVYSRINNLKLELEKRLLRNGYLDITYENNLNLYLQTFSIGLHFDLSSMRATFTAQHINNNNVTTQSLGGGTMYDRKTKYLNFNNRNNVGRGGLTICPFLDLNRNGRRDPGEPRIQGLQLRINGGRIQNNIKDTTIQIFDLEPYANYLLELNRNSFDNIAWQIKNATYKIILNPNKLTLIDVPVTIAGEVSGTVLHAGVDSTGQGGITVNFYRGTTIVAHTITEDDGYFTFLGLAPGPYIASIDALQLRKLSLKSNPASITFVIAKKPEGDVVGNIQFKLQKMITGKAPQKGVHDN